jgi:hypothetical protein
MRIVIPMKRKGDVTVPLDGDIYAAMQRLYQQQGIPIATQLAKGMREYLNYYGVHVTKRKA